MILETNQVTSSIYESIGSYVVAAVLAAIGYYAKTKYDKHVKKQDALEEEKANYNKEIIKAINNLTGTQTKLEGTIAKIVEDFETVKKDYAETREDYHETMHVIMEYFNHIDKLTVDYNKTKDAVIDIQEALKDKKYNIRVELQREFMPSLKDSHLGFYPKNSNIA